MVNYKLAEEIRNGVSNGIEDGVANSIEYITKTGAIILGSVFLIWVVVNLINWNNDDIAMGAEPEICNYPKISCDVYLDNKYFRNSSEPLLLIENLNSSSFEFKQKYEDISNILPIRQKILCGYQEANAWLNQLKESYETEFELKMVCN